MTGPKEAWRRLAARLSPASKMGTMRRVWSLPTLENKHNGNMQRRNNSRSVDNNSFTLSPLRRVFSETVGEFQTEDAKHQPIQNAKKGVRFSSHIHEWRTYGKDDYDRRNPQGKRPVAELLVIRDELDDYKQFEMLVHPYSAHLTVIYRPFEERHPQIAHAVHMQAMQRQHQALGMSRSASMEAANIHTYYDLTSPCSPAPWASRSPATHSHNPYAHQYHSPHMSRSPHLSEFQQQAYRLTHGVQKSPVGYTQSFLPMPSPALQRARSADLKVTTRKPYVAIPTGLLARPNIPIIV